MAASARDRNHRCRVFAGIAASHCFRQVGTFPPPRLKYGGLTHQRFADDGRNGLGMRQTRLEPFGGFTIPVLIEGRREGKCVRGHGVARTAVALARSGEIDSGEAPSLASASSFIRASQR
jgi:hypothetical protein